MSTTPSWSGVRAWSSIRATPSRPFGSGGKRGEDRRRRHGVRRARRGGVSGRNRQRCRLCGCGRRQDRESPPEPAPDPRARTRAAPIGPRGAVGAPGRRYAQRPRDRSAAEASGVKIAVVGTGYVGLVAGACLAETGNDVACADVDAAKIESLRQNRLPIHEPGLEPLVVRNQRDGRLEFTTDVGAAVERSDVIFIAVGTPPGEDGSADLQHVLEVARTIGRHMDRPKLVVTKSTVPVGTAERVRGEIAKHTSTAFHICANPEFLKEGAAVEDFMKPDRVIVGVDSAEAANERQKRVLLEKLARRLGDGLRGAAVAVWGLAFKAETDDVRESPALVLVEQLLGAGAQVRVHDPAALASARRHLGDRVTYAKSVYDAVDGAAALAIVTEWLEYRNPDFERIKRALTRPVIVDGRNLYDPQRMARLGFIYESIGRPVACASS